jgi:hypothetical protein
MCSDQTVKLALAKVLASKAFSSSERMSALLRYLVEHSLGGNAPKEYAIGVDVFERGESFDPKVDSIVRIYAGKVRARLLKY